MSQDYELKLAAGVAPPVDPYERATVTSSEAFKLPASFENEWITVFAKDTDVHVRFGRATMTVVLVATSATAAGELVAATNAGMIVPAGEERQYDLGRLPLKSGERLWMGHVSAVTTGRVKFDRSSDTK